MADAESTTSMKTYATPGARIIVRSFNRGPEEHNDC